MTTKELELELRAALIETGLVQPVEGGARRRGKEVEVWVLARQLPGQERAWLKVVDLILKELTAPETPEDLHLCRRYVRRGSRMVFGWHLALTGTVSELQEALATLKGALQGVGPELESGASTAADQPPRAARAPRAAFARRPEPAPPLDLNAEDPDGEGHPPQDRPLMPGQHPPNGTARALPPGREAVVAAQEPMRIRIVSEKRNSKGDLETVEEFPLPHVNREMNVPRNREGRGARGIMD